MQFLSYVLLQLDEACRHIQDGRIAQLRIALLLLDNAAEIQMERGTAVGLSFEEMNERVRSQILQIPEEKRTDDLQDLALWKPLSVKKKRAINRYFDQKIRYLTEREKKLDIRLAAPLSYLHKYRNEAYHYAKVRKETIATAAKLLLDINCELLLNLTRGGTSYASDEYYSWLEERFGEKGPKLFLNSDVLADTVAQYRATVNLNDKSVAQLLLEHLRNRIQDVFDALRFIVENTKCPDHETAIRDSYGFGESRRKQRGLPPVNSEKLERQHSIDFLNDLMSKLPQILTGSDRFESFQRFATFESDFDIIEQNVQELASYIDGMIQLEIVFHNNIIQVNHNLYSSKLKEDFHLLSSVPFFHLRLL